MRAQVSRHKTTHDKNHGETCHSSHPQVLYPTSFSRPRFRRVKMMASISNPLGANGQMGKSIKGDRYPPDLTRAPTWADRRRCCAAYVIRPSRSSPVCSVGQYCDHSGPGVVVTYIRCGEEASKRQASRRETARARESNRQERPKDITSPSTARPPTQPGHTVRAQHAGCSAQHQQVKGVIVIWPPYRRQGGRIASLDGSDAGHALTLFPRTCPKGGALRRASRG